MKEPLIIQGGMGAGVSSWKLAKAVSQAGQLGVVSGTALENILSRRLQMGDLDGSNRRALSFFPDPAVTWRVLNRYFIPRGKDSKVPFKNPPMFSQQPPRDLIELTMAANFVEVFLAKEGHSGQVGINYLEKVQLPTLPSLYGALLAGVDYVLMGAGIPRAIPGILDQLALNQEVSLKLNVQGSGAEDDFHMTFNPRDILGVRVSPLKRPKFIAIVASEVLAATWPRNPQEKWMASLWKVPRQAATTPLPVARPNSTRKVSPFTVLKMRWTRRPFKSLDCPSGWRVPMATPKS